MKKIKKYLLENLELASGELLDEDGCITNLYAQSKDGKIIFQIVYSPKKTKEPFMLQFAPAISFDRWSVSGKQIYFDKDKTLIRYLKCNELDIYKHVLAELSYDYENLESMLDNMYK